MKPVLIIALLCASLALVGCGSQPTRPDTTVPANSPEIVLPGGDVESARLLAMGMARSKGWGIVDSQNDRLILERHLPANAPQVQLLSTEDTLTPPSLQVETDFSRRNAGVRVNLQAFVVTNPGTESEQRLDYTDQYQSELLISLNALASAWLENRDRIASEVPIPPEPESPPAAEATAQASPNPTEAPAPTNAPPRAEVPSLAISAWSEPESASQEPASAPETRPEVAEGTPSDDIKVTTRSDAAASEASTPAPAAAPPRLRNSILTANNAPATAAADRTPPARTATVPTFSQEPDNASDEALVALDDNAFSGSWGAYAIASARQRGCVVGARGAVLMSSNGNSELHEVQCDNGPNLLLQCQSGICREGD